MMSLARNYLKPKTTKGRDYNIVQNKAHMRNVIVELLSLSARGKKSNNIHGKICCLHKYQIYNKSVEKYCNVESLTIKKILNVFIISFQFIMALLHISW